MEFISTIGLVIFLSLLLYFGARQGRASEPITKVKSASTVSKGSKNTSWLSRVRGWFKDQPYSVDTDKGSGTFTKEELRKRLAALAVSKPPSKDSLNMGAMCYEMAMPMGTRDIVCSHCQTKNVFKNDHRIMLLEDCQRLVQAIRKAKRPMDIALDTRFYCHKCNPALESSDTEGVYQAPFVKRAKSQKGAQGIPEADLPKGTKEPIDGLYLIISYPEQKDARRTRIDVTGLRALLAFVQGKDRIKGETDEERPLKNKLEKLKGIFGFTEL